MSHLTLMVSLFSPEGHVLRTQLWDTSEPLGLGYPFAWILEKIEEGIRVRSLKDSSVEFVSEESLVARSVLNFGGLRLSFQPVRKSLKLGSPGWQPSYLQIESGVLSDAPEEKERFKKAMKGSSGFLALFLAIAFLLPQTKPEKEEIIPPQFTKLILKPADSRGNPAQMKTKELANASKNRVNTLVQAFQSKPVRSSIQHLFKGGVLALLSKSDLLSKGKTQATLDKMFKEQSQLKNAADASNLKMAQSLEVGKLGGTGGDAAGGVGYGKGEHSVVQGQGRAFVSLDNSESSVDEGLSKDEVGKVIHEHLSEVRYCYEAAILRSPDIQGKLMVEFVIAGQALAHSNPAGHVKNAKANSVSLSDESIGDCIVKRLVKWNFPKPRGGVDVAVNYPFIFKTLGK